MNILICSWGVSLGWWVVDLRNLLFSRLKLIVVFRVLRLISSVIVMYNIYVFDLS